MVVNTLWKEGKTDEALLTVQDMERRGVVGSAALYYDLARCLCSAGRCQEALKQVLSLCFILVSYNHIFYMYVPFMYLSFGRLISLDKASLNALGVA